MASRRIKAKRIVLAGLIALAVPAYGGGPSLAMLDTLDAGRWELRDRGGAVVQRLCIGNGRQLIQLRHPGQQCESFVVQDTGDEVVVQYTCRGHGYGRTHIRRETGRLAQIESQGVLDGLPFDFAVEARRVGSCN